MKFIQSFSSTRTNLSPEKKALTVLEHLWDRKLPVNPWAIASALGVDVKELEIKDFRDHALAGKYERSAEVTGKPTAYFNPFEAPVRQRFTVAHELGHHCLNHGDNYRDTAQNFRSGTISTTESEANQFAAALLMPSTVLKSFVENSRLTDTERLALIFDVSVQAMGYRLKNLGLTDSSNSDDGVRW